MGFIQEYSSAMISIFVSLGSFGLLYPSFVEGFIIFAIMLLVVTFLLSNFFAKLRLKGYYDILLASLSIIFALAYFQKAGIFFMLSGILVLGFAVIIIGIATAEIKQAC